MRGLGRYLRLLSAFARFGLASEMAFRANFLFKLIVEIGWLSLLLLFYRLLFSPQGQVRTQNIAHWSEAEFLVFLGCYYALEGTIETFFLSNCSEFADLIRSGNLDFYLLKPIDEQFLVTMRNLDWSTVPNILLGLGVLTSGLIQMHWTFHPGQLALFALLFACGAAMAYSFLVLLMSTGVWLVRNQSLFEMWWLVTTLMRYPREIFNVSWAVPVGWFFTFLVPVLLVVNVPAAVLVNKLSDPLTIVMTMVATVVLLWTSRTFFRRALQSYRSASS